MPSLILITFGGRITIKVDLMRNESHRSLPHHGWRRELAILAMVALATTAVFWLTDLDIRFSNLFYHSDDPGNPWLHADSCLWAALYQADIYFTVVLALVVAGLVIAGARNGADRRKIIYGLFIVLTVSIGAGLLVNGILKEYWGRSRPDEILQFGGDRAYAPPWAKRPTGNGESFPSGHAAIAFSYVVFYFILRIPRPKPATACFWGAVFLGCLTGLGRVIQGRHFLSDVLWAAYIPYLVCLVFYYLVFKLPARQTRS